MEICVLGPIEIRHGSAVVRLTAPKVCALLACLLAHPNEMVSVDRLIDALWPAEPPRSASDNLRVYVAQLRRALGDGTRITHAQRGYTLTVPTDEVDAFRFEGLLRSARATEDPKAAAEAYGEALALWRGAAFGGRAGDYAMFLEEERATAIEERVDAELALGRHAKLIGELRGLVGQYPFRERLRAQLMLALYRSGRPAEALEAYREAREWLAEELGLDPGTELRALEYAILTADPALVHGVRRVVRRPRRRSKARSVLAFASVMILLAAGSATASPSVRAPAETRAFPTGDALNNGILTIGTLLPQTGVLSFLWGAMVTGARLAVNDVNAAGGVLGRPVQLVEVDSGDFGMAIDVAAVTALARDKTDVIIGPASDLIAQRILHQATTAGMVMISPTSTSALLSVATDMGLYFRTFPADPLQGALLAHLVAEDGNSSVMLVAIDNEYGRDVVSGALPVLSRLGVRVTGKIVYATDPNVPRIVAKVTRHPPDALILVGYDESIKVMKALHGPRLYLVDGNLAADYSSKLPRGTLTGTKGVTPGSPVDPAFAHRMRLANHDLSDSSDFVNGPESYDAVILAALAAEAAHGDRGRAVAARLPAVSGGGTPCHDFAGCRDLLARGIDIDYQGISGPIEFDANGDEQVGVFRVHRYGARNTREQIATRQVTLG